MTSWSTSLRCSSGRSRVASTSRLVRIAVSGVRSSCDDTAAKSRADVSAALVRSCSSQMRCSMPLTASAISTASVAPRTSMSGASSPASIGRVCCGQPLERPHRERGEQPAQHRRRADRERADDQHPAVQVVGVGDGRVVGGADGHRHRLGRADLHGAHPVAHAVDVGVGVAGGQLGQHDVGVRRHLPAAAHRDDRVLVVGRRGISSRPRGRNGIAKPAASSSRRSRRSLRSLVMPIHTIGADDADDDRRGDGRRERHAGPQRRRAAEDPRQAVIARHRAAHYCCRSTNPTPRTVCSSRGAPPASSLRRR